MILMVTLAIAVICTSLHCCMQLYIYHLLPRMLLWFCRESTFQEIVQGGNTTISQSGLLPEISEEVIYAPSITSIKQLFTVNAWMTHVQKGTYNKKILRTYLL